MDKPFIDPAGSKRYWNNSGFLHREDGPAIEYHDGTKEWWVNGKLHREDGPAVEWNYGDREYWYHGKHIDCNTTEEFIKLIKLKVFW
jgi:hypothetical protein